ncbi:MAG TPA: c-type cytochrome domain-containing protein [Candidatus Sulfotelmatobacter sp.]|jgi:mono/diheme cytochrome c family protein
MAQSLNPHSPRNIFTLLTLFAALLLPFLLIFLPPDGAQRAAWLQFIGRFHTLALHLPIAFILLVPVFELAGRHPRFSYLRSTAPLVLALAVAGAVIAAILGWCLARSGGFSGPLVSQHMWGATVFVWLAWLCWVARENAGRIRTAYPFALAAAVAAVTFTGYRGGQISFGEDHLTEFLPGLFASGNGAPDPDARDLNTFYGARIQPIFSDHCLSCHSAAKRKGGLQLTGFAALMRGGKHGAVVKAGDVRASELLRRTSLPRSDDDFMPKGKPSLSADQIKMIALWIEAGASGTAPLDSIKGASAIPAASNRVEINFPDADPAEVARNRSAISTAVARLRQQFPNLVDYDSRQSADLVINASLMGDKFGDNQLAAMAPIAAYVTSGDFSRTAITDKSAAVIGSMHRLRELRLMHTHAGDGMIQAMAALDQLESLSLFDTRVTPGALQNLAALPHLKHVYVGQTGIPAAARIPDSLKGKVQF